MKDRGRRRAQTPRTRCECKRAKGKNRSTSAADKSRTLYHQLRPGQSADANLAEHIVAGLVHNACTTTQFSIPTFGETSLMENLKALNDAVAEVQRGALGDVEGMLTAQAVALNAIFHTMAMRAQLNMDARYLDASDRYMRLALKAQAQCRTTMEAVAAQIFPR